MGEEIDRQFESHLENQSKLDRLGLFHSLDRAEMDEIFDQIFVIAKHWLVSLAPSQWQPRVSAIISVAAILTVFAALFAITTVLERKGLGRIQNRYGPNRMGPYAVL